MQNKLDKAISILLKAIIFLLPLFFLPWTGEYFEFNKQYLLWLLTPAAGLLWLLKAILAGKIVIKTNPLNLPVLIFLLLTFLSSVFSLDRFSSFFGDFYSATDAWLGLSSLIILYFLILNSGLADSREKITKLLKLFFYSIAINALVSLLALTGFLKMIGAGLQEIFLSSSFNLSGASLSAWAVLLALACYWFLSRLADHEVKKSEKIIFSIGLSLTLINLALIDFWLSWAMMLIGGCLLIIFKRLDFKFKANGENFKLKNYIAPGIIIFLSFIFLAVPKINIYKIISGEELRAEAKLGYAESYAISKEAIKNNPALGSGPGTFSADFSLYRPAEINKSQFWLLRFDKSGSFFLEIMATQGVLCFLSYFLIFLLTFYLNMVLIKKNLRKDEPKLEHEDFRVVITLLVLMFLIFISEIFLFNTTLSIFAFWLILGLNIAFWQSRQSDLFKEKIIEINSRFKSRLAYACFLAVALGAAILYAYEVRFYTAQVYFSKEFRTEKDLKTAIKLNPYRSNYEAALAKFYLNQANYEPLKPAGLRNSEEIQKNISQALERGKRAEALNLNSILPKETLAMIYRDIRPLTVGSEEWAIKYFKSAFELEPTNPVLAAELAKAYMNNNEVLEAEKYFKIALELKSDYYESKLGLAKSYIKEKRDKPALVLLNELAREYFNPEVYYELGRYYYNKGELDQAIARFKLALSIAPKHGPSLYSLGLAFEAKGQDAEALKYLKKALEASPENKEIGEKIKMLGK